MGIKLFTFLRRKQGMTADAFHEHWRDVHARHIAETPELRRHIRRYELNHRLDQDEARDRQPGEVADLGFDGVAVLWFDSLADYEALRAEPAFVELAATDGPKFREPDRPTVVTHDPDTIVDKPGREDAGAKMLCILRRNAALDLPTFHAHWLENHGGLFQRIPELNGPLIGYDQNHGVELPDAEYDGVTEQWFADLDTFVTSLAVESHPKVVEPDVAYLLDPSSIQFVMAGKPTVVFAD
jgi:hypothetical protein